MTSNYHADSEGSPRAPWNVPADDRPLCCRCEDMPVEDVGEVCERCCAEEMEARAEALAEYVRRQEDIPISPYGEAIVRLIDRVDRYRKEQKEEGTR